MKRQAVNQYLEEEVSDTFSTSVPNSSHTNQEETSPSYLNNNYQGSDSDSLSDDSGKNRRKRATYQKISNEIRVGLLDAVKNGETLKSAAKRYKINYSSAKSILHTYRKEGRIRKKSAQERTSIKKKNSISLSSVSSESHMPHKMVKRESIRGNGTYSTTQSLASIPEEISLPLFGDSRNVNHDSTMKMFSAPAENYGDNHHTTFHDERSHEESQQNAPRLFENFGPNFLDMNLMHAKLDLFRDIPQYQNFTNFLNESHSYEDLDTRWHTKSSLPEDFSTDPNVFFQAKNVEVGRFDNEMTFPSFNESNWNYLDAQHYMREALKKSPNQMYGEVQIRKSSIDYF